MYSITGITGNVGGTDAHNLLAAGQSVLAVMRDIGKGDFWAERGCEVVKADIADATSLASAFRGAEGVFVLVPPNFDPAPGFPEARATAASLKSALEKADPGQSRILIHHRREHHANITVEGRLWVFQFVSKFREAGEDAHN